MNPQTSNVIEVTVDKSHIITIGERLYGESIELLRELVNNAYDADATWVKVTLGEDSITVEDNGSGMDEEGLKQYFNIGSPLKRIERKSPRLGRDRIGEFGIGKFATLSACSRFEVWTKREDFQATVIFDKDEWQSRQDRWHLPLLIEEPDRTREDGTKVTLKTVGKKFDLAQVERRIIESCPIKAPKFSVYLNGRRVSVKFIPGYKIPFLEGTKFGVVHGEIVIISQVDSDASQCGVACKVKQAMIKKEFFGMENWRMDVARVRGEVHADFLPITSDRNDFIKDGSEYKAFREVMDRVMERVKKALDDLSDYKENRRTKRVLREVMDRVKKALTLNPDYCPEGLFPIGDEELEGREAGYVPEKVADEAKEKAGEKKPSKRAASKRKKSVKVRRLNPTAVIKKLDMGRQGVSCCIDHLGPEGPECLTEGTVIYINRDHPLHKQQIKKRDAYVLYIARLLTQEISLMKDPRSPRQAYERQSKLLKDALV